MNQSGLSHNCFQPLSEKDSREKGFTLIEMMIGLALFSMAGIVIYTVMINMTRSFTRQEASVQAQQMLRAASDLIIQDIRMSGYDPQGNAVDPDLTTDGKPGITSATTASIEFTADLDGDATIDDPVAGDGIDSADFERMAYEYNNANRRIEQVLIKADGTEVDRTILIDNITAFTLAFLDENNVNLSVPVTAANLPLIRTIDLDMTIAEPAGITGTISRSISTRIKCRNMGLD